MLENRFLRGHGKEGRLSWPKNTQVHNVTTSWTKQCAARGVRLMYHYQDWKRYHQFIRPLLTVRLTFASIALTPHTVRLTPLAFDLDQ